ncbi:MAG: hypothetical protein IJH50_10630 [Kiritimatiellae bacterium]|nr:hypothetical protein [Kiritimatiellia bacterium]
MSATMGKGAFVVLVGMLLSGTVQAATYYVKPDGDGKGFGGQSARQGQGCRYRLL